MNAGGWPLYFLLTQVIEMPVYAVTIKQRPLWQRLLIGFGASALTHPVVWFVLPALLIEPLGYWGFVIVAELFAWLVEAAYLLVFGLTLKRALLCSLAANAMSLLVGLGLHLLLG